MLGALGGVTVVALLFSRKGVKPGVILLWALFAAVSFAHAHGVPL